MLIHKALLLHPRCILTSEAEDPNNLSKHLLFDSSGSGPGGSGWRHVESTCRMDGDGDGWMEMEINIGYSYYLICNNSRPGWRCSWLLNLTVILYSPSFLSLSVFVFPHVFVFSIFAMTSMTFPQVFYGIHAFPHGPLLRTSKCIEGGVVVVIVETKRSDRKAILSIGGSLVWGGEGDTVEAQ